MLSCAALAVALSPAPSHAAIAFRAAAQASSSGPATITRVATATSTGNAASLTINRPAGVAANDVMVAQITLKGVVATVTGPAAPNDWTLLDLRSTSTVGSEVTQAVYWRLAGAAEPASYTWSWAGARVVAGGIVAYRGVEPTSPIDAWGARTNNNNATITLPNITTNSANTMLVALLGSSRASTHSAATGMTERYDVNSGAGAAGVTVSEDDQTQAAAGATGAKTSTIAAGAADNIAHLVALRARSSLTIAVPAGTVANDVMVASITFRPCSNTSGGACTVTVTPPAGWTLVDSVDQTTGGGTGGYGHRLFVYRRVATGTEPASYTWLISGTPVLNGAGGGIASFSGVDTANPIVASADQATPNAYTHAAPSINTGAVTNTMLVSTYSNNSSGTWAPPAGMTEAVDVASLAIPDDLGISLAMDYQLVAAAGATGTRTATLSNPPTSDTGATEMLALRPLAGVDHYRVQNNASGVNCQAENVPITAHDASHNAVTLTNSTTITVTARYVSGAGGGNRGDWSIVAGAGTLNNGTADDGVATYTFAAGGESSIVLALKDTWAQTVNIDVTDGVATDTSGTASADAGYNQNLTFNAAGFRFVDASNNLVPNQVAGVTSGTLNLQAIQSSACGPTGACTGVCTLPPGFASGSNVSVDLASECVNPVSCQAAQLVSITNNGTSTIAANNGGSVGSYTTKSLLFGANGTAQFTLSYPDVGAIRLYARYNIPLGTGAASPNNMTGASNSFVVKPYAFAVSNIKRTSDNFANPAASNATGPVFIRAGDDFSATVTAVNAANNATPNYGKETTPEGARLISTLVSGLGLTNNPAIVNNTALGAFSGGAASGSTFSWGDVGIITLSAGVGDSDYLGAGDVPNFPQSGNVGRFTPWDFGVSLNAPAFAPACGSGASASTYVGQPFAYATAPVITVTARNKAGGTTRNYTVAWWKLTNSSLTGRTYSAATGTLNTSALPSTTVDPAIVDLGGASSGTGTLTFTTSTAPSESLSFTRTTPIAAFDADISLAINVIDSDAIAYASNPARFGLASPGNGISFGAGNSKQMRFGRLRIYNAVGSELIDLPVQLETQYWNGTGFITNADDNCTAVNKSNVAFANFQKNLSACQTSFTTPPSAVTFTTGRASVTLKKPGAGNSGSVDLRVNLGASASGNSCINSASTVATTANRSWLRGNWTGAAWDQDPSARASFGLYRNSSDFIYFKENY